MDKYIYIKKPSEREDFVQALKEVGECIQQNAESILPSDLKQVAHISCSFEITSNGVAEVVVKIKRLATIRVSEET